VSVLQWAFCCNRTSGTFQLLWVYDPIKGQLQFNCAIGVTQHQVEQQQHKRSICTRYTRRNTYSQTDYFYFLPSVINGPALSLAWIQLLRYYRSGRKTKNLLGEASASSVKWRGWRMGT